MSEETLFPSYIRRAEEQQIRQEAALVREDERSRAVLLYGQGGVGKTQLVRQLAQTGSDAGTVWLGPIDIDDPEYWLLSNLETLVARHLDPEHVYFERYFDYLSRLPNYTRPRVGHETVVSHLGRIKRVFLDCYKEFVERSGKTVVIIFNTVETIRGMYLLLTLTQWIKALPSTLFVLSGRPVDDDKWDPIRNELEDPYQSIPVKIIRIDEFPQESALDYLNSSSVSAGLTDDEKKKIVRLTRGHPLWLAFTVAYLQDNGLPEEVDRELAVIEREIPFQGEMTEAGQIRHDDFKRRIIAPYSGTDFWRETVKRLAVIRESVNQPIWQQLMADDLLTEEITSGEAWHRLLETPWIRPRANRHFVTLHDAVAEELAQRIFPLHDQDKQWRHRLWQRAVSVYRGLADVREVELAGKLAELDQTLQLWDARARPEVPGPPTEEEARFIEEAAELDAQKRELYQFRAIGLYYEVLCDFGAGCQRFLSLFDEARTQHDILFQDLLAFEMQRFLPIDSHEYPLDDAIGEVIADFRTWLSSAEGRGYYLAIGLSMADYLIRGDQPRMAMDLLDLLPVGSADHRQRYQLSTQRGNACMRIRGRVREGSGHFAAALAEARLVQSPDRSKLIAGALKELGFYYRNEGQWEMADQSYEEARDEISKTLATGGTDEDREEMASIQTNWAYLKGLGGDYRDGINLAESAVNVRHRLGRIQEEGISWSVCGEVYRYERRFRKAWNAYAAAEQIFQGQRDWSWLGLIYQEQAICLFQAAQDGISLTLTRDPIEQAEYLITLALDLCRDLAIRGQPSALNRAGRIFGEKNFDIGLRYLADGIDLARELSDGWFQFANLVEYVELCYRAWAETGVISYREKIEARAGEIADVMDEYEFPDLKGRWELVRGHLGINDWLENAGDSLLAASLEHYKEGFRQVAERYAGSSGAAAIASEFETFGELVWKLPPEIRRQWQAELREAWTGLPHGSTLLLARLEELY